MAKAVFLDRDETLNPDPGYIDDPAKFEVYPWVPDALKRLRFAGFKLVLITNQSGIGRGLIQPQALDAIHRKLNTILQNNGVAPFELIEICTHCPEDNCDCRKPKPKLILDAAHKLQLELSQCYLIGDRDSDIEAGNNAGLRKSFKIVSGSQKDFLKAVEEILKISSS
jgi:histidinol-phosphate phosphatase family protein